MQSVVRRGVRLPAFGWGLAAALDRRRRPHRAADGPQPRGARTGVQHGRAGGVQHVDSVDPDSSTWAGSSAGPSGSEYVVLTIALVLSVAGIALVMLGAAQLYAPGVSGKRALLLAGALVYIAIPPARDFATSGLENCLVIAWIGALWLMMVRWSQQTRNNPWFIGSLAVVAGLSVLVRPELALVGGLALVMLLVATPGWRHRVLIVAAGGLPPVGYEIFRMGYYGLLVPQTALAKDASGAKWSQGFVYLTNFSTPYALWIPALLLIAIGIILVAARGNAAGSPDRISARGPLTSRLRSPAAVVVSWCSADSGPKTDSPGR